jgi:alpha-L-rhamnosidase
MKLKTILFAALAAFTIAASLATAQAIEFTDLRCEYLTNPRGIDVTKPRLSWVLEDIGQKPEIRGQRQTAYQLLVASTSELLANDRGDLWDSGKVEEDQSIQVEYKGKPLDSRLRCFWKVRVWDKDGNPSAWSAASEWTMGLLNPADWSAKWIAQGSDFEGAQWIWFNEGNPPGGAPEGTRQFRRSIALPTDRSLTSAKVRITADNSFTLTINGKSVASGKEWAQRVDADITAALQTGNNSFAISATNSVPGAAGLIARFDFTFASGEPLTVVTDGQWQASTDGAQWSNALSLGTHGIAPWGAVSSPNASDPWMRKEFTLAARPETAMAFVNVQGYYELFVNGEKVGNDVLSPAVSDFRKRTLYRAYDISKLLRPGGNCIGLWLGKGWAGSGVKARVQLNMTVGGQDRVVGTDRSWTFAPSTHSLLGTWSWGDFGGECIDARRDIPDWSKPGCKTGDWKPVRECDAPASQVVAQSCEPNRIGQVIPLAKCTSLGANVWELDFGTNLSGWLKLKMPGLAAGQKVVMRYADKRFQSLAGDKTPAGDIRASGEWVIKTDGGDVAYQNFKQIDEFISAGKKGEQFCSKFNYHGFRYVIVEGLKNAPEQGAAQALLIESDLNVAGDFECSNDLFNRIHKVNVWTLRSLNLGGYMVDCPHRERLGYGDGQLGVESLIMSRQAPAFYAKWTEDWLDGQTETGDLPHTAPAQGGGGGPAWGGAGCVLPSKLYQFYGDKRLLARAYEPMRKYVEFLESRCTDGILRAYGGQWDFIGDWVPPGRGMDGNNWPGKPSAELFNNCYRVYLIEQLAKASEILGKTDESQRWLAKLREIRPLIHKAFYDPSAKQYVIDEQAYQLMPLMTGVVPDDLKETVMKRLEELIQVKNKGHLDTGMLGTYFLLQYLQESGRNDLVYTIMNQTTYPGWGYMVSQGATTLWEQWNGYYSQIHSCFTCPSGWFYQGLAGIRPGPAAPGFKNILIKPAIVGDLTWVKSHHDSPYGRIVSNWKREGDKLTMEVTIPVNTTATIHVPAKNAAAVTESGNAIGKAGGVKFLRMENSAAVYDVGSGSYRFQSTLTSSAK